MKKKSLKKLVGIALGIMLLTNGVSSNVQALPSGGDASVEQLIKSIKENTSIKPNNSSKYNKIGDDINLESDETIDIIIEFVTPSKAILSNSEAQTFGLTESKVDRDHEVFTNFLSSMPQTYSADQPTVKYTYKEVFNGQSLSIKASDIPKLLECDVIKRIYKNNEITVEPPVEDKAKLVDDNSVEPYMLDSIPHLGVDDLHEEGIDGKGIKVGVLDTGVDYNHPDLQSIYKGFKNQDGDENSQNIDSTIGWDFVDNDADAMETTYKNWQETEYPETDSNGNKYYTSHGTHVSGTIAGTQEGEGDFAVKGIAPQVELYGYRVLGPYGSGSTAAIISGIEKSVKDGMDVINLSLGNAGINDPYDPMVTATNNATLAGVVTVISNGNSGPDPFTVSAPATAQLPIAVGASTVDYSINRYGISIKDNDNTIEILSEEMARDLGQSIAELEEKEFDFVDCGLGDIADFEGKDLTGKVAVIDRGNLAFVEKIANATEAGAELIIMINNVDEGSMPYLGELCGINTLGISKEDGQKLKSMIDSKIEIKFKDENKIEGDELAGFSSVGPVKRSFEIRPDIVAPGSQVLSTLPEYINDKELDVDNYNVAYGRMSGTSMAAPHVTGVAALILQANPEYTPEEVKAALMNTSEIIYKNDGTNYSVHEIGAGRINAYKAVHEEVKITTEYEIITGEMYESLNNITAMLSYGKVIRNEEAESTNIEKVIPVTITNRTSEAKEYNITVEYVVTERSSSCIDNGITIDIIENINVPANSTETFDATLKVPQTAEYGQYEGFVHITDVNSEETYQIPFGTTVLKDGFGMLSYPESMDGTGKGLTAFNSSAISDRLPHILYIGTDINFILSVNESIKYIHTFLKDTESGEYIGHAGTEDGSWFLEGQPMIIQNIVPNGRVNEIINGEVSNVQTLVEEGIYELEIIGEAEGGRTFKESLPICIINNSDETQLTTNFEPGVVEVTEDMYTEESWQDGNSYEGIWLKGHMESAYIKELKENYGMDYLKQQELSILFTEGYYSNGDQTFVGTMIDENADFKVAGIERSDLSDGFFRTDLYYASPSKVMGTPRSYIFIPEGKQYLDIKFDKNKYNEETGLGTTVSINNANDIVEGTFTIEHRGDSILNIESIKATEELNEILDHNGNKIEIEYEIVKELDVDNIIVSFKVVKGDNDIVGLTNDIDLFDISLDVEDFRAFDESLVVDERLIYSSFIGLEGNFKNSLDKDEEVEVGTIHKYIELEHKNRTIIYGSVDMPSRNIEDVDIYAIDEQGNKYEPTYRMMLNTSHLYTFNNLPVIDGHYKIIGESAGALKSVINVKGGKLNRDGELVGTTNTLISDNVLIGQPNRLSFGDVNNDGVIDIIDVNELAKEYHAEIPTVKCTDGYIRDLNNDAAVNRIDMEMLLENYGKRDMTIENVKEVENYIDGRDIIDILESVGFYNEIPQMDVVLSKDKEATLVGEAVMLVATPPVEEVEFEYEFSIREENDTEWTVIRERNTDPTAIWSGEKAGNYEIKVRIYEDNVAYVAQDNLDHIVSAIDIVSISLDTKNVELTIGDKFELNVNISPENAEPQEFIWESSNKDVVKVENGVLTAVKEGEAVVSVKTKDGSHEDSCNVVVKHKEEKPDEDKDDEDKDPTKPDEDKDDDDKEPVKPDEDNNNDKDPVKPNEDKDDLPETGAPISSVSVVAIASLLVLAGVKLNRKKNN